MDDLTALSTGCTVYKTGDRVQAWSDAYSCMQEYIYVYCPSALTQYQPSAISYAATCGQEVQAGGASAVTTGISTKVVVPQITVTSGKYCFALIRGKGTAGLDASTNSVSGKGLYLTGAGTVFTSTTSTVGTAYTAAYLITATTAVTGVVFMPGEPATIY